MTQKIHCSYLTNTNIEIKTDGVKDILHTAHDGKNQYATPGDLLVAALGACTLTMMGVIAEKNGEKLDGAKLSLTPVFAENLSGLQKVDLHIVFPPHFSSDLRRKCLNAAKSCPVHRSLNPAIVSNITCE